MCDTFTTYRIDARVVPAPKDGWNSGGRQVPSFYLASWDADSAARIAARVLLSAAPDADYINVVAFREDGSEQGHATAGRDAQMNSDCVSY